jgi:preprotein translocase subunit SecG
MSVAEIIVGIVLIVFSLLIIAVVLLQEGRQANLGSIAGAADTFLEKGKARTLDAMLAKWTKVIAITFFVLVFAGMLITTFLGAK